MCNNIRDTCAVNIFIYLLFKSVIFITCEHKREIMVENTKHNVNHISIIISKLNWILSHSRWSFGSYRTNLVQEKYLIRFVQVLIYLDGFRTETCRKVHIIN